MVLRVGNEWPVQQQDFIFKEFVLPWIIFNGNYTELWPDNKRYH